MRVELSPRRASSAVPDLLLFLTAVTVLGAYQAARFGGRWGEIDTNVFAGAIRAMVADPRLMPRGTMYPNGYGFPVLGTVLVRLTGLSVAHLQIFGGPLLALWVVLPAWLAYRALTGSARGATVATILILIQPEFLFSILRGTHEKFTRGLMFLCLYLLVRSIATRRHWQRLGGLLLAFYLAGYALTTFNNLMSTSFIVALGLSLLLSLSVHRLGGSAGDDSTATCRRLLYAVGTSLVLAFLFTFHAYPPARYGLLAIQSMWDRTAMLLLGLQAVAVNPYDTITTAWISGPAYLLVSLANWLLLGLSFTLWSVETLLWWRNRAWPEEPRALLLWSLYGAFGFLGAVSILIDFSGALSSNLQHRIFPSFAMIAAALVAERWVRRPPRRPAARRPGAIAISVGISFLALLAVAKATNEPALSNKWAYYAPSEFAALNWSRHTSPTAATWAGFDERLRVALGICCAWEAAGARMDSFYPKAGTRNFLISDVIRARGIRLNRPLPLPADSLRVYDNGTAEIYRLRPRTPYQR